MGRYRRRTLEGRIAEISSQFPAVLVTGPRQVGKTTLLQHVAEKNRRYVSLDDPAQRELAVADPNLFLERFPPPLLIDEIQYAPGLLPYLKLRIDALRQPGAFWLTGSQQFQMMKGVTETLAGRVAVINLLGFSQRERFGERWDVEPFLPDARVLARRGTLGITGEQALYEAIWSGGFPALVTGEVADRALFFSSYLQTYLQRDVRDLAQVGSIEVFTRFVRACAARTAQLLNLSDLARDVDVSVPTAKSWLSVLVASCQVFLLQPFHTNVTNRLVKTPKLYFLDTGLCAYLTGWASPATLAAGAMRGAIFETHVVAEVLKSWWHRALSPPIHLYRDRDGGEIDLVFDVDGMLWPMEIKHAATVRREWAGAFAALGRLRTPVASGAVVCLTAEPHPLTREITALPIGAL
ncbi:MAG: ATP-binding protein [Candidatus Binatia bacterium]